jgi:hypothetical protein
MGAIGRDVFKSRGEGVYGRSKHALVGEPYD